MEKSVLFFLVRDDILVKRKQDSFFVSLSGKSTIILHGIGKIKPLLALLSFYAPITCWLGRAFDDKKYIECGCVIP
jgi:hypothetical protein